MVIEENADNDGEWKAVGFYFSSYVNNNVDVDFVVSGMLTLMPKVSKHKSITISD